MAESSDIIKEFLVALGFKVDQASLNKFDSGLVKATKATVQFATVAAAGATAATVFVDKVATKMEDLYWTSVRVKDGAANIQQFALDLSKAGGTAEGAVSALENMAAYLRTNPAGETFLNNIGVRTRDAAGNMVSTISLVKQLAALPIPYWLKVRHAARFGITERDLQAIIRAAPEASNKLNDLYARAGISADDAAAKSKEFKNTLRDIGAVWDVLAVIGETRLLPVVNGFLWVLEKTAGVLIDLDKLTGGFTSNLIVMAGALWGVNTAMNAAFGAGIIKMLSSIALWIATMTATMFPALSEAVLALGAAIELTPVGWIITGIALVAAAAALVITHWDKVKEYFTGFVDWLRQKYNAVAKYLGLPTWEAGSASGAPTSPPRAGQGRDFRGEEANLGPWSAYGSDPFAGRRNPGPGGAQGGDAALTGKALAFFEKAGWTAEQSAGLVANLLAESKLNPNAVGDHGAAYGIGQWHRDRQEAFRAWAGKDIRDSNLDEQLAFVNHELTQGAEKFAGKMLAGANNAAQAGAIISKYYERPADQAGQAAARARTASSLVAGSRLAPGGGRGGIKIEQTNNYKITGNDADAIGRAVKREQGRSNGDLTRNFAGAVAG